MTQIFSPMLRRFNQVVDNVQRLYHEMALSAGLSDSCFQTMYMLYETGGCRQKDISDASGLPKQTIHSAVKQLMANGCVAAEKGHGRDVMLYLTEKGWQLARETVEETIRCENAALAAMSEQDQVELIRLHEEYYHLLEKTYQQSKEKSNAHSTI